MTRTRAYLADCLQTATWLVRALDQRAKTILKVSSEIVRQQDGFFANGVQHLRPLNLKTVADAISMHELTVSRVTANKYMATSRGIFELKYFFTSSIAAADGGEAHSAEAVRHRIRQLIDGESTENVSVRRHHRRQIARCRHRHRAPHGRQIPRSHAHSLLGAAPPRKAGRRHVKSDPSQTALDALEHFYADNLLIAWPRGRRHESPNGGKQCLCVSRVKTSVSARHCSEQITERVEEATSKYFRGGYSGHATVGRDGFGFRTECMLHLDSGASLEAEGMAPMPMTVPNRRRSVSKSGCGAINAAARIIKRVVAAKILERHYNAALMPLTAGQTAPYGPPPSTSPLQLGAAISDHWTCP